MRLPKSQHVRLAVLGVIATVLAFFLFRGSAGTTPMDPVDAVPKESFLVGTVDVSELRRSPIYDVLLGKSGAAGGKALGLGAVEEACGFDPFTRIERLAVAVPEKEGERDIGIVGRVQVTRDELQTCKRRLDDKRGGEASAPKERGDFLEIDGVQAGSTKGRLAYGKDLLVVSTGEWFDAIVATANREKPSVRDAKEHASLRASLTEREGWRVPTVLVTAILPKALRDRIRGESGPDATMIGVLGVSAVGLAVKAGPPGGHVDARIQMVCDSPDECGAVEKLIQKKRLDWSKDLALRMVGFGQVIDSLETKRSGATLEVSASANADMLANTLERVLKLRSGRNEPPPLPFAAPPAAPRATPREGAPDETIPSPRAADGG